MRALLVIFAVGCAILVAAFGIGWGKWVEPTYAVVGFILGAPGAIIALLVAMGIMSRDKLRWTALFLAAIMILGFSALVFFSIGILFAPVGLVLLGISIWKLTHYRATA